MPSLTTYLMVLFGIGIALYFAGYTPILFHIMQCGTASTCTPSTSFVNGVLDNIIGSLSNPAILLTAAAALFVPFLIGGSFGLIYIIPIMIVMALSNFVLLPTDFLLSTSMPWELSVIILGFINIWLLMGVISFIRGGD